MNTFVALVRGINVGGNSSLPMKDFVSVLEFLGAKNVKTYIQSGNAVFLYAKKTFDLSKAITAEVKKRHGLEPHVLVFDMTSLEKAIAGNPFPEAETDPKSLHLGFLASIPNRPDLKKLDALKKDSERYALKGDVFYLHAPEGVGRSKLAAQSEKALGVPMTDRNWRTVCKIKELAEALP